MRVREPQPSPEFVGANIVDLNVAVRLLDMFAHRRGYGLAYVDSLGVIERLTSSDLVHKAEAWAYLLRRRDVRPGDRVVVLATRDREWRSALLAVMQVGGVAVPCPVEMPVAEVRAIAADAGAVFLLSARARPDLVEAVGTPVLSAEDLDSATATWSDIELVYRSRPGDLALILYGRDIAGLGGAMFTHASLIAQAKDGGLWLGVRENERVWCTAHDGSIESIWLLLAAWGAGAEIVTIDAALDPGAQLELLEKLDASAVWLSDDEYRMLVSAPAPAWVTLASTRRALTRDVPADGAIAFAEAFGAKVVPVLGLRETGVLAGWPLGKEVHAAPGAGLPLPGIELSIVDERGNELSPSEVGAVRVRAGAPTFFAGYAAEGGHAPGRNEWLSLSARGAVGSDGRLKLASDAPLELERNDAVASVSAPERVAAEAAPASAAAALTSSVPEAPRRDEERAAAEEEQRRRAEEAERAELEAALAEQRRRAAEEKQRAEDERRREKERRAEEKQARREEERLAKESEKAEEQRRREEAKNRELAERAAAEERRRAEQAERAEERRRAEEERQRAEEEKRREKERRGEQKQSRRDEAKERKEAERAEREAARTEERRRAEEEKQRAQEEKRREEQRRRDEKEARRREEQEAKEREKAERVQREAAVAEDRRRAEDDKQRAEEEKQHGKQRRREEERQEKEREKAERALHEAAIAEERRRAEEEKRQEKERERAESEKRKGALADERRREEEEKQRKRNEERAAKERAKADGRRRRVEAKSRKKEGRPAVTEQPEPERLAPDILGVLSAYGVKPADPDQRRESEEPSAAASRERRRDGE